MTTLTITELTRCAGGNHYAVTVDVDGVSYSIDFESADLSRRRADAEQLAGLVLPVVMDDINAVRDAAGGRKATLNEERTAVVGKVITARGNVETDAQTQIVAEGGR